MGAVEKSWGSLGKLPNPFTRGAREMLLPSG